MMVINLDNKFSLVSPNQSTKVIDIENGITLKKEKKSTNTKNVVVDKINVISLLGNIRPTENV